jgi:nucleotide-binding universal stress UspA family protein
MEFPEYTRILFCTDFSDNSDAAFPTACGIAERNDALLYVLYVLPEDTHHEFVSSFMTPDQAKHVRQQIQHKIERNFKERYLDRIGDRIKVETQTVTGREDEEILNFAEKNGADLIVLGTHGRTGLEHALFGSIADKVIRHSHISVLVVPARKSPMYD